MHVEEVQGRKQSRRAYTTSSFQISSPELLKNTHRLLLTPIRTLYINTPHKFSDRQRLVAAEKPPHYLDHTRPDSQEHTHIQRGRTQRSLKQQTLAIFLPS